MKVAFASMAAGFVLSASALVAHASELQGPQSQSYVGGRGLITTEGPTGLFQNVTSGTLKRGDFGTQACLSFNESFGDHFTGLGVLVSYGVTDWLEVGTFGVFVDGLNPAAVGQSNLEAGQIYSRVRLLRDEGALPEFSIGVQVQRGDFPLDRETLFFAASKGVTFEDRHFLRSMRVHAGGRTVWLEGGDGRLNTLFVGGEVELFKGLFLVAEINTKDDSDFEQPYSFGLQYRQGAFGLSLARIQAGGETDPMTYVGIGVSF